MEKLGPDDDWDSEHVPQAIELHAVTKFRNSMKCLIFHCILEHK